MSRVWKTFAERREKRDVAAEERQRRIDYRAVFGSDTGQRVLADIMQRCGVMQTSFRPGLPDETAYNQGRQRAALEIVQTINMDPNAALKMAQSGETEDIFNDR